MAARGPRSARGRRTAAVAASLLLALPLAACSAGTGAAEPATPADHVPGVDEGGDGAAPGDEPSGAAGGPGAEAPRADLPPLPDELTDQRPDWGRCPAPTPEQGGGNAPGDGFECATLTVPLDYAEPAGDTLDLALIRGPARGDEPIGSLVFNFGGPGGSGVATLPGVADRFAGPHEAFDLVSFDPRGVGASAAVVCQDDAERDAALAAHRYPADEAQAAAHLAEREAFAASCADRHGALLPQLTTENTARDLDLLRAALGEERLHYYGASYGTKLGGVYAGLHPERVGRMVLDSAVDPTATVVRRGLAQATGFQEALDRFLTDCVSRDDCPVPGDGSEGHRHLNALLDGLADAPLPAGDGRVLTQSQAVTGVVAALYSTAGWARLRAALTEIETAGDGASLLAEADRYNGRDAQGRYRNLHDANTAINCADFASRPDLATVRAERAAFEEAAPVLGRFLVWDLLDCAGWPATTDRDQPHVAAAGARPVLVLATTGDPATPYHGGTAMRAALGEGVGVLVTHDGDGHGAYLTGNTCVTRAVDGHLVAGSPPTDGLVCD